MRSETITKMFEKLWLQGKTYGEMSKDLGVAKQTLYNWRAGLGLPTRKRGPKPRWKTAK